jgi:hypothetical protein
MNERRDSTAMDVTTNMVSLDPCIQTFGFPDGPMEISKQVK